LHLSFGLVSFGDELFELGGTGPSQAVKLKLVGHGAACLSCVAA
jgi:hypothetical protein